MLLDKSHAATNASTQAEPFEYELAPVLRVEGDTNEAKTMSEHAEQLGVPAAAFAVYKNGALIHQEYTGEGIGPNSMFQGASLAKSISAATIVTLAEQHDISLDEDISAHITSFDLTTLEGYEAPVTLRELLSHSSQANVSGFQGYPQSAELPTNVQVILGSEITNSDRVAFTQPAGKYYYSGGGFQIAQAFAEDVSGKPFDQLAQELIFAPLGMDKTMFRTVMDPDTVSPLVPVSGFENRGPVDGGWHNYPELATAGLWTTATDFAKFITAIMAAADGDENAGIPPSVAREMLTKVVDLNPYRSYGLGLGLILAEDGSIQTFEHHGRNVGFRVSFSAFPKDRALSIMLTNHPKGLQLATETHRGVGLNFGYVDPAVRTITPVPISEDLRAQCIGVYTAADEEAATVELLEDDGKVIFRDEDGDYPLIPTGEGQFIYVPLGITFTCEASGDGTVLSYGSSNRFIKQ